uniref:CARD domain-containing protein n=1 Tax=Magallana gigas TaxID=29159 RepID=K1PAD3_MAGGI
MFLDIEQIKSNILDNLPEILDVMSVAALQTPFVSAGIMSYEELDLLHMNSESVRTENLHFVRMVLHRGDEAVRIFLVALENSIGLKYNGNSPNSTMDSDEDVPEDLNVLSRKSSKYQSILVRKLHELETVQNVMNIFRVISEEEMQLMAVKNILSEEQHKRLEKYIIKLQVISNKIEEATGLAKVA